MAQRFIPTRRTANPVTRAAFRRQVWLEIYLPIGLTIGVVIILAAVAAAAAWGTASSWADTVVVFLAVPVAILLLLLLVVLVAACVGLIVAIRRIPEYTVAGQDGLVRLSQGVRQGSDAAARVVILPSAAVEALAEAGRALRSLFRSRRSGSDE